MKKLALLICVALVALLISPAAFAQCPCSRCRLGMCIPSNFGYCNCSDNLPTCIVDTECGIGRPAGKKALGLPGTPKADSSLGSTRVGGGDESASARRPAPCASGDSAEAAGVRYRVVSVEIF